MLSVLYYICIIIFFMAGFILGSYVILNLMADKKPKFKKEKKIKKKDKTQETIIEDDEEDSYVYDSTSLSDEAMADMSEEDRYAAVESMRQKQTNSYNYAKKGS